MDRVDMIFLIIAEIFLKGGMEVREGWGVGA